MKGKKCVLFLLAINVVQMSAKARDNTGKKVTRDWKCPDLEHWMFLRFNFFTFTQFIDRNYLIYIFSIFEGISAEGFAVHANR